MTKRNKSEVDRRLLRIGAVLLRCNTHEVWRLPNGRKFVKAQTPSDHRAQLNQMKQLDRLTGERDSGNDVAAADL